MFDTYEAIQPFYGLQNATAFEELTELLTMLACTEQEFEPPEAGEITLTARRAEGHRLALSMQKHASSMYESLTSISRARERFEQVIGYNPPLFEAIFDVDGKNPYGVGFPPQIRVLNSFFEDVDWDKVAEALRSLAEMPVRAKLARGPVPKATLRRAVRACRTYWRDQEGRSWSMSSLKDKNVRDLNDLNNLQGLCEGFVADALGQCSIVFGLHDLCSAWTAIDQA